MPLNFGGQKRSGAFDTVWPPANAVSAMLFAVWQHVFGGNFAPGAHFPSPASKPAWKFGWWRALRPQTCLPPARVAPLPWGSAENPALGPRNQTPSHLLMGVALLAHPAKAGSTLRSSQAVPHPSTNRALCRLTSEVRRDPVHSTRYGRQQKWMPTRCLDHWLLATAGPHVWKELQ